MSERDDEELLDGGGLGEPDGGGRWWPPPPASFSRRKGVLPAIRKGRRRRGAPQRRYLIWISACFSATKLLELKSEASAKALPALNGPGPMSSVTVCLRSSQVAGEATKPYASGCWTNTRMNPVGSSGLNSKPGTH